MDGMICGKITGLERPVSRIFLGTAAGPLLAGENADALLDGAVERGVNAFDCARSYGLAENALAILNPFTTGYLRPAGATPRDFVKDELTVPPGEVPHHRHVHPPGNVWLVKTVCRLPGSWGGGLLPETGRELEELRKQDGLIAPLDTPEMIEAALKLTVLLVLALALGKLVLARMLWRMPGVRARGTAVLTVLFGSNAAVLFLGHYDTFYFLLAALVLCRSCLPSANRSGRFLPDF